MEYFDEKETLYRLKQGKGNPLEVMAMFSFYLGYSAIQKELERLANEHEQTESDTD